jgi:hypothetical protein
MTNDCRFLATNKVGLNQVNSFTFEKSRIGISVPMKDTFPFKAMKETHEHHKTKIDIDELITGPTNITLFLIISVLCVKCSLAALNTKQQKDVLHFLAR